MAKAKTARTKKNGNGNGAEETVNPSVQTLTETKSEPKTNVIPINLEEEIRQRAYEIFEERGRTPGNEHEDWVRAEREVLARYEQTA
jgi:hypothetical protein